MIKRTKGELHLHTTYSDGVITAMDIERCGLDFVVITDHDTVNGFRAVKPSIGKGVEVLPGIEFSTYYNGIGIHVLGYFFDYKNPELEKHLEYYRRKRVERAKKNFHVLRDLGYLVDERRINNNGTIAKPNIARIIFSEKKNLELLIKNRIWTVDNFIDDYLIKGRPAYAPVEKISLDTIRRLCKGPLVLAHPGEDLMMERDDWVIRGLRERYNLRGIEVFSRKHSVEQMKYYLALARKLGLLPVPSSDAHHPEQIGMYPADYRIINLMLNSR